MEIKVNITILLFSRLHSTFLGFFILNVVVRDDQLRPMILNNLKETFHTMVSYKLQEDLNEIFICSNFQFDIENLKEGCYELNMFFKKHNTIDNGVDIDKFLSSINVHNKS